MDIVEVKALLADALNRAFQRAVEESALAACDTSAATVAPPADAKFGDFSSNLAMVAAGPAGKPPRAVAEAVVARLEVDPAVVAGVEIAGAGFINFRLAPQWLQYVLRDACRADADYGRSRAASPRRVLVEFVSSNPTGPVSVAHARGGAIGDVLATLLEWTGHAVEREFYVNDALNSRQIQKFAESVEARYLQALGQPVEMPEDGYRGYYVVEMARAIIERDGDRYAQMAHEERLAAFTEMSLRQIVEDMRIDLEAFGIRFDTWFYESSLYRSGAVQEAIDTLTAGGWTYEDEGALWLRTTAFGDEKDRVLVRSNGEPMYLASDVAYHQHKWGRQLDYLIDIWGPDNHGHVQPTRAAMEALGYNPESLEILIFQIVRLMSDGELVRVSKRAGDIVCLSELIEEVGRDAARFYYLIRSAQSPFDFDLDLAKKQSLDNPVYYVQYGHARICSILREAEKAGVEMPDAQAVDLSCLTEDAEIALMRRVADFPAEVALAAELRQPHRMTRVAQDVAEAFHTFYHQCRVLGESPEVTGARLVLVRGTQIVLRNVLTILGVSAPERM